MSGLKLLVEVARGTGNKDAPRYAPLAVLHTLHDARRLAAFGTVGALGRVHYFFAICSLGNFSHQVSPVVGVPSILSHAAAMGSPRGAYAVARAGLRNAF